MGLWEGWVKDGEQGGLLFAQERKTMVLFAFCDLSKYCFSFVYHTLPSAGSQPIAYGGSSFASHITPLLAPRFLYTSTLWSTSCSIVGILREPSERGESDSAHSVSSIAAYTFTVEMLRRVKAR